MSRDVVMLDSGGTNLGSVQYAFERLGVRAELSDNLLDEKTFTRGYASYSVLPVQPRRLSVRLDLRVDRKR